MGIILKKKSPTDQVTEQVKKVGSLINKAVMPSPTLPGQAKKLGQELIAAANAAQPPVAEAIEEGLSPRQQEALVAAGLAPVPQKKIIKPKMKPLETGMRVRVTNDLFTWIMAYKFGDTGVIERVTRAVDSVHTIPIRDDMYLLRLDDPTTNPVVIVKRWEIEEIKEEIAA